MGVWGYGREERGVGDRMTDRNVRPTDGVKRRHGTSPLTFKDNRARVPDLPEVRDRTLRRIVRFLDEIVREKFGFFRICGEESKSLGRSLTLLSRNVPLSLAVVRRQSRSRAADERR